MDRKIATLAGTIVLLLIGSAFVLVYLGRIENGTTTTGLPIIYEPLDPVPPADPVPGVQPFNVTVDGLNISAEGTFQLYMLHAGNRYFLRIEIRVTNTNLDPVTDFNATKASVYFQDSEFFYTFGLLTESNTTIGAQSSGQLQYSNDRRMPNPPTLIGSYFQYARIHVTTGEGLEFVLTTSLASLLIAIE
ncbi:MAG: hypothetical protein EAX95_10450 [Candidatus Thorarchaeota archaeon]|nr:hypothetical protein [Candidatus Thorarchaeota archaeon]